MTKAIAALMTIVTLIGFGATQANAAEMNDTVVVRFNNKTGTAEQMVISRDIHDESDAKAAVREGKFKAIPNNKLARNELDREAGASSWYVWCGGWGGGVWATTPSYYYYGYTYPAYYGYSYANYSYYYYGYRGCGWGWGWGC